MNPQTKGNHCWKFKQETDVSDCYFETPFWSLWGTQSVAVKGRARRPEAAAVVQGGDPGGRERMKGIGRERCVGRRVNVTLSLYIDKRHPSEGRLSRRHHTQPFAEKPWTLLRAPQEGTTRQGVDPVLSVCHPLFRSAVLRAGTSRQPARW